MLPDDDGDTWEVSSEASSSSSWFSLLHHTVKDALSDRETDQNETPGLGSVTSSGYTDVSPESCNSGKTILLLTAIPASSSPRIADAHGAVIAVTAMQSTRISQKSPRGHASKPATSTSRS
ncbi:unnamed protein product [Symbiodinium natans]|uniref:Uncharacterized protein n=1 Tax=Symbiodinium natans TaxID=878477 RepID=A0A812TZF5_9DINO|nr:unnamed protein product [Symbiodinium natans]